MLTLAAESIELYRASLTTSWISKLFELLAPLVQESGDWISEGLPQHSATVLSMHDERVTSAFYRALCSCFRVPRADHAGPLLYDAIVLPELASLIGRDRRANLQVPGPTCDCTAWEFMENLTSNFFKLFMSAIGSRSGKNSNDFSDGDYYVTDLEDGGNGCSGDYSDHMRLLFSGQLGHVLFSTGDGRQSVAGFAQYVRGQFFRDKRRHFPKLSDNDSRAGWQQQLQA